ncbi:MAG TPA: hypothetical protein EYO58_11905 [Flavobacteriales bacterium]|nr:hypothetical protein [Flavobacteriales bacterium]
MVPEHDSLPKTHTILHPIESPTPLKLNLNKLVLHTKIFVSHFLIYRTLSSFTIYARTYIPYYLNFNFKLNYSNILLKYSNILLKTTRLFIK